MADIQKLYEQWLAKATADPDLKAELESIKDDEDGSKDYGEDSQEADD